MSTKLFLTLANGIQQLVSGITSSAGAGDADKLIATDSSGKLDSTFLPVGVGADTITIEASENLAAGDFVNIHDATGVRVRKADASNTRPAHGFVLASVTSGNNATVYLSGRNTGLTGLTVGARYYLSAATAGGAVATAPSASGNISQYLGVADSTTSIQFEDNSYVSIA